MASTIAQFDFALKDRYTNKQTVENLCFSDRVTLGKLTKDTDFQGRGHPVPVIIRSPLGLSVSLQNAQTNATTNSGAAGNVKGAVFNVTSGDFSGAVDIGEKVIRASRANPGAFLQDKQAEIDGLYGGQSDVMAAAVQGNGTNVLGYSNATVTTTTVTLANPSDAMYFEPDTLLEASTATGASGSDALLAGTAYVAGRNLNTGVITLSALPAEWNAAGVLYFFRAGTFMGNVGNFITHGFGSYVDGSAAPPDLYSVTAAQRLADINRLAGVHTTSTEIAGLGTEVRMQMLGAKMTGRAKGPGGKYWTMHPEDWQTLAIALQSRGQRALKDETTSFGYMYLEIIAGGVRGEVYSDRFNPKGFARCWKLDSWTLFSMGQLVGPLTGDGLQMLRKSQTNDYEYRLVSFPGMGCNAPGWNGQTAV